MDKTNKNPNVPNLRFPLFIDNWKLQSINSLLSFQNGINADANKYGKGIKYISVGDILNNVYINYENIKGLVNIDESTLNNYSVTYGDILFQRSSETPEDIGRTNIYLDNDKVATFGGFVIRGKKIGVYNPLFFHYLLKSPSSRKSIMRLGAGAQHYNIGQESLRCLSFYFPQLFEQEKIANLLFKIDARIQTQIKIIELLISQISWIKQYYIKKNSTDKNVILSHICSITTGKKDANAMVQNGKYKFFTCSKEEYFIDTYSFEGDALIISGNGELGQIKYYNGKFDAYQRTYVLQNFKCNAKYLKYILEIELPRKIEREKNIGAMPYIVLKTIADINICLPSIENQNIIVDKIEKFEQHLNIEKNILVCMKKEKDYLLANLFI